MVADVEPVAHVPAVAVHGQRLAGERVDDHQRNELFRKLARPVVVRAVGRQRGQSVGVMIGAHQMVGRGLRCGVRTVRRVAASLRERGIVRAERAVHFVGRHVQEAEASCAPRPAPRPSTRAPPRAGGTCRRRSCRRKPPDRGSTGRRGSRPRNSRSRAADAACSSASTCARSPMSPRTKMCRASPRSVARLPRLPAYVSLSRLTTGSPPFSSQSSTKLEPMNPAPPVTRITRSTPDTTRRSARGRRRAACAAQIRSPQRDGRSPRTSPERRPAASARIRGSRPGREGPRVWR